MITQTYADRVVGTDGEHDEPGLPVDADYGKERRLVPRWQLDLLRVMVR